MNKLIMTLACTALLTGLAKAQPAADPRVSDLAQAGKIRVGAALGGCTERIRRRAR
jgi:hypothetical protein